MSYDLCLLPQAKKPYYIENIRMNIYSLEELCFYLYNNACLIDESLLNERLLDWLRDELGLTRLYRQLYDQLEKKDGIGFLVLPIFREAGYLTTSAMREYQEQLQKLEVQSADMKQKLRGDYLVKERMYGRAVSEYREVLKRKNPGKLGVQFYAAIWNNLGAAYAGMLDFRRAADCFLEAYHLTRTKETFRKYISTLPLFLSEEDYQKQLEELKADPYLVQKIQEYNAKMCTSEEYLEEKGGSIGVLLGVLVSLFDPAMIVIGGSCVELQEELSPIVEKKLSSLCPLACSEGLVIRWDDSSRSTLYQGMSQVVYEGWNPLCMTDPQPGKEKNSRD